MGLTTLTHPPFTLLTMEIDQECRVIAQTAGRASGAPTPVVPDVPQAVPKLIVHEGLIEPEAITTVGRIPRVGAFWPAKDSERVEPARLLEPGQPGVFAGPEHRGFLVDPRPA